MKKILRFSLLALLMTVFNGAWAAETPYKTLQFGAAYNSQGVSSYASSWFATYDDGFTCNISNFNNNSNQWNFIRGGSKNSAWTGSITTAASIDKAVTKVVVTVDAVANNNGSILEVANNAEFTNAATVTLTLSGAGDATYTIDSPIENAYYRLTFDQNQGTKNGDLQISKIQFFVEEEGPAPICTINQLKTELILGETFTPDDVFEIEHNPNLDGSRISHNMGDFVNINSPSAFVYEPIEVGEASFTITCHYTPADGEEGYDDVVQTLSFTVVDPNGPGTENNPYTVEQARAAIDAGTGVNGVYAKGIVSEIVTAYNSQFGNITYNISADGTTDAVQLQAYRGKNYEGANFTSEDDIQVGDEVVIFGDLKKYNQTYEFDQGNQLVSLDRKPPIAEMTQLLTELTLGAEYDVYDLIQVVEAEGADPTKISRGVGGYGDSFDYTDYGKYKAVQEGPAQITLTWEYHPGEGNENPYSKVVKTFNFTIVDSAIDPELSFEPSTMTLVKGDTYNQPTINCVDEIRGLLSITSDNQDVAFWNGEAGLIVGTVTGTATITATYNGSYLNGKYKSATATLVVNVVDELPVEETATFDATKDIASTGETASAWSITKDGLTISCTNGVGGNGTEYRIYKNQTFTVSSTVGKITKIEFTATSSNPVSGFGEVEGLNGDTWTGSADEVAFTASGAQVRLTLVNITYEPNGVEPAVPVAEITTDLTDLEMGTPIRWEDFTITYAEGVDEDDVEVDYDVEGFQMDLEQGLLPEGAETATITFTFTYGGEGNYSDVEKTFTFNVVDNRPDPAFAFTPNTMTIVKGEDFEQPEFSCADENLISVMSYVSDNSNVADWNPEDGLVLGGELGTANIVVWYNSPIYDTDWKSSNALLTVTVVDELPAEVTYRKVTSTDELTDGKYLIVYEDGNVAFDGSLTELDASGNHQEVTITDDEIVTDAAIYFTLDVTAGTIQSASGYYIGITGGSNGLGQSVDAEAYTNTFSFNEGKAVIVSGNNMTLSYNSDSNQKRFRYFKNGGQKPIALYKEVVEEPEVVTVTISESTYATFYYESKAFEIPEGITASAVVREGSSLSEIPVENVIPAGCPVLLHGAAGEYEFVETTEEGVMPTANSLIGSEEGGTYNEAGYKYYVLSWKNKNKNPEEVGFYYLSGSKGAYAKVKAHQAYMRVVSTQANEAGYVIGETTGITSIAADGNDSTAPMYNLAGQRVNDSFRGVVIQNGKKTIKK
jgi:hypothetical protein